MKLLKAKKNTIHILRRTQERICPELAAKARDELYEVESRIPDDIATLRVWVENQPHLTARTEDQFLLSFLRGSKYSIEKAKQKIDFYYTIRSLTPEVFVNKPIDDRMLRLARLGVFVSLPNPLKVDGPRLYIASYGKINPNEFNLVDIFKLKLRVTDIQLHEDDNSIIAGMMCIVDFSKIHLGLLLQFDPVMTKKFGMFAEKALPLRIKGVHFINVPKGAVSFVNLCRSISGKKFMERMILHTSFDSLYEHIPKKLLPKEYGGENGHIQDSIDYWEKKFIQYKDFFDDDVKYGANESLRVGAKFSSESLFGLDGTFRKLEVD